MRTWLPRSLGRLALALAWLALAPHAASAQIADATLELIVVDQTRQVVPGATVTASNPATGFTTATVTDSIGLARIPALPPGTYDVRVELSGFAPVEQRSVAVRVGQMVRLNVTLSAAQVAESVTVVGQAPLVDIHKTDSSTNIVP